MEKLHFICFGKGGIRAVTMSEYLAAGSIAPDSVAMCDWEFYVDPQSAGADAPRIWRCPLSGCGNTHVDLIPVQT